MAEIASLFAKIGADTSQFERAMHGVDSRLNGAGRAFGALGSIIKTGFVAAAAAGAATVGTLAAVIVKSTNAAADMEQQIANIAAVLGLTAEQSAQVGELIKDLGLDPKLQVNAVEAGQAIEMLAKNGLTLDQIMNGAARSTVLLANATGADFAMAADIATDAMAVFGIRAEDMASAVDGIVSVTNASKFSIDDYALALAQGGGVASAVGVSFEDFNTTIAAISPLFASGSDAGTSFKTFLQRLVPQSKEAAVAMRKLGLFSGLTDTEFDKLQEKIEKTRKEIAELDPASTDYTKKLEKLTAKLKEQEKQLVAGNNAFFDAEGNMKDMAQVVQVLHDATKGLSEEQKNAYFSTIFGTDAMRAAFAMAGMTEEQFRELAGSMAQVSAEESAATRMDTFRGALEILSGVIETLSIGIGEKFLPVARKIVEWATQMADTNGNAIIDWFGGIADSVGRMVDRLIEASRGGLPTVLAEIGEMLGELGAAFGNWASNIWESKVLPALTIYWSNLLSWLGDNIRAMDIAGRLANWAGAFVEWIAGLWANHILPRAAEFWSNLTAWITDPAKRQELGNAIANAWTAFTDWAAGVWEIVGPALGRFWASLTSWITDPIKHSQLWDGITGAWSAFWDWAAGIGARVAPHLHTLWQNITSWVTDPAKRAQLWEKVVNTWHGFTQWAADTWSNVQPHLQTMYENLNSWIDTNTPQLRPWLDAFSEFWSAVRADWELQVPILNETIATFRTRLEEDFEGIRNAWKRLFGGDGEKGDTANWLGEWVSKIGAMLIVYGTGMVEDFVAGLRQALEQVVLMKEALQALSNNDWGGVWAKLSEAGQLAELYRIRMLASDEERRRRYEEILNITGRAGGGPVNAHAPYIVGENGPELFVPTSAGNIVPNGAGGRLDIYIHGDSNLPTDRAKIRELAIALQRELDFMGARVALV